MNAPKNASAPHLGAEKERSDLTITESEVTLNPLASFISKTGLIVDDFPCIQFSITIPLATHVSMKPKSIIIRVPHFEFGFFESTFRAVRVLESIENATNKTQTVNFEWTFLTDPQSEELFHPLFGLLAAETICPTCRASFRPQPTIKSSTAVDIQCPECRSLWTLDASTGATLTKAFDLFESYRLNPVLTERKIERLNHTNLSHRESKSDDIFPFQIERKSSLTNDFRIITIPKNLESDDLYRGILNQFARDALTPKVKKNKPSEITNIDRNPETTTREILTEETSEPLPTEKPATRSMVNGLAVVGLVALLATILIPLGLMRDQNISVQNNATSLISRESFTPENSEKTLTATIEKFIDERESQDHQKKNGMTPLISMETTLLTAQPKIPAAIDESRKRHSSSVIASKPDSPVERDLRQARMHTKLKQYSEALRYLSAAQKKDPTNMEVFPALVLAQFETKNYEDASKTLEQYLKMKVDPELRPALESLQEKLKSYLATAKKG